MALSTGKKIVWRTWDMIPMLDTVIARVNTLGGDQPEQMIFTDRHGRLIGDNNNHAIPGVHFEEEDDNKIPGVDAVELPGVDMIVDEQDKEDPAPPIVEMYDLDNPNTAPPLVETDQVHNDLPAPEQPTNAPTAVPVESQATRRSARIRTKPSA